MALAAKTIDQIPGTRRDSVNDAVSTVRSVRQSVKFESSQKDSQHVRFAAINEGKACNTSRAAKVRELWVWITSPPRCLQPAPAHNTVFPILRCKNPEAQQPTEKGCARVRQAHLPQPCLIVAHGRRGPAWYLPVSRRPGAARTVTTSQGHDVFVRVSSNKLFIVPILRQHLRLHRA